MLIPSIVAVIVFIAVLLLSSKRTAGKVDRRKQSAMSELSGLVQDNTLISADEVNLLKGGAALPTEGVWGAIAKLSIVQSTYDLLLKAGLEFKVKQVLMICGGITLVLTILLFHKLSVAALPVAVLLTLFGLRRYLKKRIKKRSFTFVEQFPDAIDMIVRGVRSGQALSIALRMIADNMDPPVATEFRQVIDEVAYGRQLTEALRRMATRIAEEDVHFFVVVLAVQQETGGNLSEVLGNLSGILRKRKALRNKIKALTAEGRMTSYILGGLPVFEFGLLYFMSPGYLDPLFTNTTGNIILGAAIGLIILTQWVVNMMINAVAI